MPKLAQGRQHVHWMRLEADHTDLARQTRCRAHRVETKMRAEIKKDIAGLQMTIKQSAGRKLEPCVFRF